MPQLANCTWSRPCARPLGQLACTRAVPEAEQATPKRAATHGLKGAPPQEEGIASPRGPRARVGGTGDVAEHCKEGLPIPSQFPVDHAKNKPTISFFGHNSQGQTLGQTFFFPVPGPPPPHIRSGIHVPPPPCQVLYLLSYLAMSSCRIGNISSQLCCLVWYWPTTGDRLYPLTVRKGCG
jgi:hypothetical protein